MHSPLTTLQPRPSLAITFPEPSQHRRQPALALALLLHSRVPALQLLLCPNVFLQGCFLLAQNMQTSSGPCKPAKFFAIRWALQLLQQNVDPRLKGETLFQVCLSCVLPLSPKVPYKIFFYPTVTLFSTFNNSLHYTALFKLFCGFCHLIGCRLIYPARCHQNAHPLP